MATVLSTAVSDPPGGECAYHRQTAATITAIEIAMSAETRGERRTDEAANRLDVSSRFDYAARIAPARSAGVSTAVLFALRR